MLPPGTKWYNKKMMPPGTKWLDTCDPSGVRSANTNDPGGVTRFIFFAKGKQNLPSNQYTSIGKTQIAGIGVNDVINNFNIKVVSTRHESFCKIQI